MVLPLPIKTPVWDGSVRFLNLEECEDFFDRMHRLFPLPRTKGLDSFSASSANLADLPVIEVGSYVASFVPSQKDFSRLDKRFQVSPENWAKLPQYRDYGFAVFQLKPGSSRIHPMAFVFESRLQGKLFFPTIHIHDGEVSENDHFDHTLYAQGWLNSVFVESGWHASKQIAGSQLSEEKTKGLVWAGGKVFRRTLKGEYPNKDQTLTGRV